MSSATSDASDTTAPAADPAPAAPAKRVRKVKKPRPVGYPRRPTSAFIAFMNSKRAEFVAEVAASASGKESGASNITAVSQLAKVAWANLSDDEKKPWTDDAAEKLRLFNEAAKKWRDENPVVLKKEEEDDDVAEAPASKKKKKKVAPAPGTVKKVASAYIIYSVAERTNSVAELTLENGSAPTFAEVARKTAAKWGKISEAEKKVFQDKAKDLADAAKAAAEEELKQMAPAPAAAEAPAAAAEAPAEAPAEVEPAPAEAPAASAPAAAPPAPAPKKPAKKKAPKKAAAAKAGEEAEA